MSYHPSTPPTSSFSPSPYASSSRLGPNGQTQSQPQPITRSRTLFYLSVRDSSGPSYSRARRRPTAHVQYGDTVDVAEEEEEVGLMNGSGGGGAEERRGGLPPKWVDTSDEVEEILSRIAPKIAALDKLHAKHVLPGFNDRTAEEREIERRTGDITRDLRRCSTLVSSIQPGPRAQRVELMTAKNVQRGLAQKVQEASAVFRKKQRVYMQKLQGHAIKNKDLLAASGAITLRGPESFDELADDELATKQLQPASSLAQTQSQSQATVALDLDLSARSNEITQIASSISELADLFRDLGNLVVEQGTVLDSVEYNVQMTARDLKGAVEELKVAQRYQSNSGRRRCILLLILLIVGLILVLIYKPRSNPPSPPPSQPGQGGSEYVTISHTAALPSGTLRRPNRPALPKPPTLEPLPVGDDEE